MKLDNHKDRAESSYRWLVLAGIIFVVNALVWPPFSVTGLQQASVTNGSAAAISTEHKQEDTNKEKQQQPVLLHVQPEQAKSREQYNKFGIQISTAIAVRTGETLLRDGNVPALEGQFELPFANYLSIVERLGGKLAVFDRQTNRVAGTVEHGDFLPDISLKAYARRARDVTDDVPSSLRREYLALANSHHGGAYRFLILLPKQMVARFVGTLAEVLKAEGIDMKTLDRVMFVYRQGTGEVLVEIREVERRGERIPITATARLWP